MLPAMWAMGGPALASMLQSHILHGELSGEMVAWLSRVPGKSECGRASGMMLGTRSRWPRFAPSGMSALPM
jgi:hypothetical protein